MRNGIVKAKWDWMGHMKAVGQRDDAPFKTFRRGEFGQMERRVQQLPLGFVRRLRLDNNQKIDIGDIPTEGILCDGTVDIDADEISSENLLYGARQFVEQAGKFLLLVMRYCLAIVHGHDGDKKGIPLASDAFD